MGTRPNALARHQLTQLTRFGVFDSEEMQKELARLGIAGLDELNSELTRLGVRPPPAWSCGPGMRAPDSTPPPPPRKICSPLRSGIRDSAVILPPAL